MRLILVLLISLSFPAFGQVYKWTDTSGQVHFGNQPPPGKKQQVEIRESSPGAMGSSRQYGNSESDIIRQARELEHRKREQRYEAAKEAVRYDGRSRAEAEPENSWACEYERERVEEYKIQLQELGRKGYRIWEKDQIESQLREAERQAQRDCN